MKLPNCTKPEMKTLKKEELTAFLEETKRSGCYEFYYLELTTGMRLGEICALEWNDLSLENKTITVNKAVQKIKGEVKINTPKTKSSIRTIKLCDECIRLLSELKANQMPKSKYIFPSSVTGGIKDTSAVTRRLHRIQDRAGVPRIRFHDLRHPYVKHTTKIFSLRLMNFQAQAYPDARRKTRGACQLLRVDKAKALSVHSAIESDFHICYLNRKCLGFCMRSQCAYRGTPAPGRSATRPARWSACPH